MKWSDEEVINFIEEYKDMEDNSTGGSLHIYTDDGNCEDDSIEFCIEYAKDGKDIFGVALGKLLLSLSVKQREKIYNKLWE